MNIGGRNEGVCNDIDFGISRSRKTDFHHVKPHRDARFPQQLKPRHGSAHNQRLLGGSDRLHRVAVPRAAAALHLDEHQRIAVARHQIHLTPAGRPEVAIENLVARAAQGTGGQPLPFPAQPGPVVLRRGRAAPFSGEETCDDGLEKAHILPAWLDAPEWRTPCAGKSGIAGKGRPSRS
mgnify:CR=1 FL=1